MRVKLGQVWLPLLAIVLACGGSTAPSSPRVRIEPTFTTYFPGDSVFIALRNIGPSPLHFSACGSSLEMFSEGHWTSIAVQVDPCTAHLNPAVASGGTETHHAGALPATLSAGTYRYVVASILTLEREMLSAAERASAPFLVASQD